MTTAGTECSDSSYALLGGRWGGNYIYFVYFASLPGSNVDKTNFRQRIFDGHTAWNSTVNNCGFNDQKNIVGAWSGDAARPASMTPDSLDVVDYGATATFCGSSTALACAYVWRNASGQIAESDQRFSSSYPWYTGTGAVPSSQYDLWSTASHETGHTIGLDHVGNCDLTMGAPCRAPGQSHRRDLGRGYVLGMRALYPNGIL